MRDRAGRLVLMDFGSGHDAQRLADSTVECTPLYAAPEVLSGEPPSVRSDIYSLGVLLWYLLRGSYPVNGRSVDEIRRAHASGRIAKQQGRRAVSSVAMLAVECLASDPRKRPPTASELGRRLRACIQPSGVRRRSIRNWSALGAFAAAVLLLATVPLQVSPNAGSRALGASVEPIWSFDSGAIPSGAPSADGHYFACSAPQIPVAICDVTTGTVQRVPITDQWKVLFNVQPLISPDGQYVAYHGLDLEEARIFDLSTSAAKSLRVDPSLFVKIIGWSASGDSLLVVLWPSGGRPGASVALLDRNTGARTDLRQFDARPDDVALSHDSRHLAFTQGGDLNVTNLVTGETLHIGGPDVRGSLLWTQNDAGLLFTSGMNAAELHLIRLTDGHPTGDTEALRAYGAPPFALLGISATGNLYYNTDRGVLVTMPSATGHVLATLSVTYPQLATLYLAPFDTTTQQIGTLAPVAMLASHLGADWSADSKSIAYARSDGTRTPSIVIRDTETARERKLELPDDSVGSSTRQTRGWQTFPWVGVIRWSTQGKILVHASANNYLVDPHDSSVRRVDLPRVISPADSTSVRRDVFRELYTPTSVEWAPDGSSVFYAGNGFVRGVNVDTGTLTESHALPEIAFRRSVQLSPGERLLAYTKPSVGKFEGGQVQVDVAALDDNPPGPLLVTERACRPVGWWNREVFVACLPDSKAPNRSALYLIDVVTGTKKAIRVDIQRIDHVRVRPDGRAIAIMAGQTTFGTFVLRVPGQ